jgi:hypothetical protein
MAALLYSGKDSVITGEAALGRLGIRVPLTEAVDVLIPHQRRRRSADFVRTHRTRNMPAQHWQSHGVRWAQAARATADAVRGESDLRQARALVAAAVQQRKCTVDQLIAELRGGPAQGSAVLRQVLREVAAGADSVTEIEFQQLIKASELPEPMYNAKLYSGELFLAKPDAWWPDAGVAAEVDSREWHLLPDHWQRTMARQDKMGSHGIIVLHFSPQRIRTEQAKVVSELRLALQSGSARPRLDIRAVPSR